MQLTIKQTFNILTWLALSWTSLAVAEELPSVEDFQAEARAAQAKGVPILVLYMSPHCPYCERVLQEFLLPMGRNADYDKKVIMRQIDIGSNAKLRDFSGKLTTHRKFADEHKVKLVPTVAFYDASGRDVAGPIVGLLTPDFYGGYLDNAIDDGLAKIRSVAETRAKGVN